MNMLFVKTKIGLSKIQGIGLFSDEDILKGTLVYEACLYLGRYLDVVVWTEDEWNVLEKQLNEESFKQIKRCTYKHKKDNTYNFELDNTRFINHSDKPNIAENTKGRDVAIRDIKKGEEILINYKMFYDKDYFEEIMML